MDRRIVERDASRGLGLGLGEDVLSDIRDKALQRRGAGLHCRRARLHRRVWAHPQCVYEACSGL
jgi:hypothetical protein